MTISTAIMKYLVFITTFDLYTDLAVIMLVSSTKIGSTVNTASNKCLILFDRRWTLCLLILSENLHVLVFSLSYY